MKTFFKKIIEKIITWEAHAVLKKYRPKIVAVTGSVGKTSTKDAIYTVLSGRYATRKSDKSMNSEIGVPLTILGLRNGWTNPFIWLKNIIEGLLLVVLPVKYPEWLVLEVGADKPGDIEKIAAWIKPDIAVITQFGEVPVHVEFFPSVEDLINEKGHLAHALKEDGMFIYNSDDKRIADFSESILRKKVTYGFKAADVQSSREGIIYSTYDASDLEFPSGMMVKIKHAGVVMPIEVAGALGRQHIYPVLAAVAVGISTGVSTEDIVKALGAHVPPQGRMKVIDGIKDTVLIDDSYNSSPVAVEAALNLLHKLKVAGKKYAVLGDMMELGNYSIQEHRKMGKLAAKHADVLVCVGVRSRGTADAALDASMSELNILQFDTAEEAGKYLQTIITVGDILLIKGSQAMRMERIVEELMQHPEDKESLLVRQDPAWLAKR